MVGRNRIPLETIAVLGQNFHPETWGRRSEAIFDEYKDVSGALGKNPPSCSLVFRLPREDYFI